MASQEYSITLDKPESLTPETVGSVFSVVQEQRIACLSDIKRQTGLKYDQIRAVLGFLKSRNLISVMKEKAGKLDLKAEQIPVKVTKDGSRTSLEEVSKMLP